MKHYKEKIIKLETKVIHGKKISLEIAFGKPAIGFIQDDNYMTLWFKDFETAKKAYDSLVLPGVLIDPDK